MAKFRGAVLSCQTCGESFKVPPSRSKSAKYCSKRCADPHRNADMRLAKLEVVCQQCGKTFLEHRSHAGRRKYCSYECKHSNKDYKATISSHTAGASSPQWKGGSTDHSCGYIYKHAPNHPFSSNGYVFEHRLVAEKCLRESDPESKHLIPLGDNLYLSPTAVVHHINQDRKDNRPENLTVLTKSEHNSLHNDLRKTSNHSRSQS